MKIGPNIEINKEAGDVKHDALDKQPVKEHPMAQDGNSRMLAKKHDDEKLFTIGGAVENAFSGTNFVFNQLTDHGEEERKRHDLALEKLQRARDKWNEDRMK